MSRSIEAAQGHWPSILAAMAGLSAAQLTNKHQPCPLCGGKDRYRFDDQDGSGSWFCNKCGGKDQRGGGGNGMDMLMRRNDWTFKEAISQLDRHLGLTQPKPSPPIRGAESVWHYSSNFIVCRFPGKKIRPLWWDGSAWKWKAPPAPRPLLNLERIRSSADPVRVTEGEKAGDAAQRLFPGHVCTTWPSGCKAINQADWRPLEGRQVLLWPDNDEPGIEAMQKLAQKLRGVGAASVQIVDPPPEATDGWDLADSSWTPEQAHKFIANHAQPEPKPLNSAQHFTCLGFDADAYYYQPHSTGQVMRLGRAAHYSTNLAALAPLEYWEQLAPGSKSPIDWTKAAATLFAVQAEVGVYNPLRIRGRGAWWDDGRSVLHLGDRLLANSKTHPVLEPFPSAYIYQRLSHLSGYGTSQPLSDADSLAICEIAERFHWEVPASGLLLAGWVTLAPICGALRWRPHVWLTAAAGSGKSAILDRFISPLLGDMGLIVSGNTTEAGIRQTLRSDALPIVFDEAESNEKADQVRMQNILALARVASSESNATMLKGSPGGDVTRFHVRSMFMLSSIATSLKQGADRSRFAQLTLRNPSEIPKNERMRHWERLDQDLEHIITRETSRRLIARTVSLIPEIRASAQGFGRVAADRFDSQRLGDQYGTLLAGAWSLMSREVPTDQQAQQLIDQNDWEPFRQATEIPDERRCLDRILQHQVRVETNEKTYTRTIGELVEIACHHTQDIDITLKEASQTLGRHGLKVEIDGPSVLVSNTANALAEILKDTPWAHSWGTVLSRLNGAERTNAVRFSGAGTVSKAVRVSVAIL